jgi:hypothetical protein
MKAYALQFSEQDDAEQWSGAGEREPDYCTQDGAAALKATIEAYWAERGQHVLVSLHNVGFHPAIRAARFDVRSDMVNGKPRGAAVGRRKPADVFAEDFDQQDDDLSFE